MIDMCVCLSGPDKVFREDPSDGLTFDQQPE